jgi:two-component system, LuxR family, response regulator FixJ
MAMMDENLLVYVVEDDDAVLKSICALLKAHGHDTVPCASAEEFLKVFRPDQQACMVLDLRLPGMSGMELQAHLNDMQVNLPIVFLTAHGDVPIAVQALRAGAVDFIEKPAAPHRLLESIRLAGGPAYGHPYPNIPKTIVSNRLSKLTARERDVLDLLLLGKLNKEIAEELGVSQRTVEVHRSRIREKMQARGIADLIRMIG